MKLQRQILNQVFSRKFSASNIQCSVKLEVLPKKSLADERLKSTIISNLTPNTPGTTRFLCQTQKLRNSQKVLRGEHTELIL